VRVQASVTKAYDHGHTRTDTGGIEYAQNDFAIAIRNREVALIRFGGCARFDVGRRGCGHVGRRFAVNQRRHPRLPWWNPRDPPLCRRLKRSVWRLALYCSNNNIKRPRMGMFPLKIPYNASIVPDAVHGSLPQHYAALHVTVTGESLRESWTKEEEEESSSFGQQQKQRRRSKMEDPLSLYHSRHLTTKPEIVAELPSCRDHHRHIQKLVSSSSRLVACVAGQRKTCQF
jgi:hypothetical protein